MIAQFSFEIQGTLVRLKSNQRGYKTPSTAGKRGQVTGFSRKSRSRLLALANRIDMVGAALGKPIVFITLTYGQWWASHDDCKLHLRAFLARLRRFAPEASGLWRVEGQERGAPHFHLILFNLPYLPKNELQSWWGSIIGQVYWNWDTPNGEPRPPFTRIEAINSGRRAMGYVTKYVAKIDIEKFKLGVSSERFSSERDARTSGFNYVPYLHEPCPHPKFDEWIGRHWGVFNRAEIPFAKLVSTVITVSSRKDEEIFHHIRRAMAKCYPNLSRRKKYDGGSLLFRAGAYRWWDLFLHYLIEYG